MYKRQGRTLATGFTVHRNSQVVPNPSGLKCCSLDWDDRLWNPNILEHSWCFTWHLAVVDIFFFSILDFALYVRQFCLDCSFLHTWVIEIFFKCHTERQGTAHVGFPEHVDTLLNWACRWFFVGYLPGDWCSFCEWWESVCVLSLIHISEPTRR